MTDHIPFPRIGFVRIDSILGPKGPIPVSNSTWWAGIRTGRFPEPVKLGPRITAWRAEQIWQLIRDPERVDFREKPADDVSASGESLEQAASGAQQDKTSPSPDGEEGDDEEDDDDELIIRSPDLQRGGASR